MRYGGGREASGYLRSVSFLLCGPACLSLAAHADVLHDVPQPPALGVAALAHHHEGLGRRDGVDKERGRERVDEQGMCEGTEWM